MASKRRVMIVDDDESICTLYALVLEKDGIECHAFTDPREALRDINVEYDCLITDMVMRRMDGFNFVEAMRKLRPGIPILMTTGYATHTAAFDMRMKDISMLAKPVDPKKLIEWVQATKPRPEDA